MARREQLVPPLMEFDKNDREAAAAGSTSSGAGFFRWNPVVATDEKCAWDIHTIKGKGHYILGCCCVKLVEMVLVRP